MVRENSFRWVVAGVLALALGAVVLLTALGGNSKAAGSPAATQAATGPAVDIWTAAPIATPAVDAPQVTGGVKAAFRYLNSHGGLGKLHQKVNVRVCNTQFSPPGEIQCAAQAAGDKNAIAMVAPLIILGTAQFTSTLQKAGLPAVNPAASDDSVVKNPINFPLGGEYLDQAGCAALMQKAIRGAKRIGFGTTALPNSITLMNVGIAAAKKLGLTTVGDVEFPVTATDVTPFVSQLAAKNPQMVALSASPPLVGAWLAAAARLGKSVPTCVGDRLIPPGVLMGLGGQANKFYVAASYPDVNWSGYPLLGQFRQQANAETNSGDKTASLAPSNNNEDVLVGWLGAQAVIQAANNVKGPITRAKFLGALRHTTVSFGKGKGAVLPTINFAKPNRNPKYPRLFNTTMFLKKWSPAKKAFELAPGVKAVNGNAIVP